MDATTPRTIYSGANPHALAFAHSRVGGEGLVTFTGHISIKRKATGRQVAPANMQGRDGRDRPWIMDGEEGGSGQ